MQTEETNQNPGATEIFRMPAADATVPDLMAQQKPANPTLTIVKGPQVGQTFELDQAEITLGRDPKNSVFLNDMTSPTSPPDSSPSRTCAPSTAPGLTAPSSPAPA